NMSLAYTASIGTGFFSAGLVDAGEDFSATGTLTARGGASNGLFETAAVSGVPEPSTWAMALIGFAGLMGYRALRMTSAAAA
ncbi:MAG TPA: PEP-CTERM sorting domain-containing protein, partial [Roseiarcus sp.]|nr:PEP-CTERM sorting domain-containing protein [Roseiarcus sp.]